MAEDTVVPSRGLKLTSNGGVCMVIEVVDVVRSEIERMSRRRKKYHNKKRLYLPQERQGKFQWNERQDGSKGLKVRRRKVGRFGGLGLGGKEMKRNELS